MNKIQHEARLSRRAASAAGLRIPLDEATNEYVIEELGPAPTVPAAPPPPDVSAFKQELNRVEEELTKHPMSAGTIKALVVLLFAIEAMGCNLLMQSIGMENPTRLVWGMTLALFFFVLTYITWKLGGRQTNASGAPWLRRGFYIALAVWAAILFAFVILRTENVPGSEESSRLYGPAVAVLVMCTTIGPAWLAEMLLRLLTPMIPLIRTRDLNLRRIVETQHEHDIACAPTKEATTRNEQWQREADRIKAAFRGRYNTVLAVRNDVAKEPGSGTNNTAPNAITTVPATAPANGDAA